MMKQEQADQTRVDNLSQKIKRLLDQGSLVGAVIVLRSLQSDEAHRVLEQLSAEDRERIYDASFAWKDENMVEDTKVVQLEPVSQTRQKEASRPLPFFPHQLLSVLTTAALVTSLILILTIFSPAKLGVKADVLNTSPGVKPEWYFLFLYSFFSIVPSILGVVAPIVGIVALALLPYLDKNPEVKVDKRRFAIAACSILIGALIVLSVLGAYYF